MNTVIAMAQSIETVVLNPGACGRERVQQPVWAVDYLAPLADQSTSFLLAYRVDAFVEGLGDVEVIDNERGVRTMMLHHRGVSAAHVASGPGDMSELLVAQGLSKEAIAQFAAVSGPEQHHSGALEVIDQCSEFAPLAVRDLVGSEIIEAPDAVSIGPGGDDVVRYPRKCRAVHADPRFDPVGDERTAGRPEDLLLYPTMRRALDFRGVRARAGARSQ